jgi:putative hydrolase of HD superfamily
LSSHTIYLFVYSLEIVALSDIVKIIDLIRHGESLKTITRTGWILAGVESEKIESVAEHSYGCIFIAIIIANHLKTERVEIDLGKVALLAALHDLPESITGDIARTKEFLEDGGLVEAKKSVEKSAIATIFRPLGKSCLNLRRYWNEFDTQDTIEALIVKSADILDMLIHARQLEESGIAPESLHQFFETSKKTIEKIDIEIVAAIYDELFNEHISKVNS